MMHGFLYEIILYSLTGIVAGGLAGLLGIGGGTLIVPALALVFHHLNFSTHLNMHLAVGSSLGIMVFTSPVSVWRHTQHAKVPWPIFWELFPGLVLGCIAGVLLADFLHPHVLRLFFGVFLLLISLHTFFQKPSGKSNQQPNLPRRPGLTIVGAIIGGNSGLLGVGGGSLSVPYLLSRRLPMKRTVTVSALITFVVALVGTGTAIVTGMDEIGLPKLSTGYVYWPAVVFVAFPGLFAAYVAAPWAHRLPEILLRRIFAVFLMVVALHMFSFIHL